MFETENSFYINGEWLDKAHTAITLPNGTTFRTTPAVPDGVITNSQSSTGMEFPSTDIYYLNPTIDVSTVRHTSKHYLTARILKQLDDFAFNGAKVKVIAPEDEAKDVGEDETHEVQAKVNAIDAKVVKTITRLRQTAYDEIIYGSALFERIDGTIEDWKAPVILKRLPAYSFCETPMGRVDFMRYVSGDILLGIIYDKVKCTYEYWQKQNNVGNPVQIPTKQIIHIRDEVSESVDGDSFIAKVVPLIKKLEFSDVALMETVHRAGAPLLWITIEEYRESPLAQGAGLWTPKKAYEEGKKISMNHGKNNAMVAPSCITPKTLDYSLPINPMDVVKGFEMRILNALIPKDFTEDAGASISKSAAPAMELLKLVAEGWRERVSRPFIEMWNKILEENGYEGWTVTIEWRELTPENKTAVFARAKVAFDMGTVFTENEIRAIAGYGPKSDEDIAKEEEAKAAADAKKQQELDQMAALKTGGQPPIQAPPVKGKPKAAPKAAPGKLSEGADVKTESGKVVKDKQEKPLKNSEEDVKAILDKKAREFELWIKQMGYWPE